MFTTEHATPTELRNLAADAVPIDATRYGSGKNDTAEIFLASYGGRVVGVPQRHEFAVWTGHRWAAVDLVHVAGSLWRKGVCDPLRNAADRLDAEADQLERAGFEETAEETRKRATEYRRRALAAGNLPAITAALRYALTIRQAPPTGPEPEP
ncbi:hypothetical protein [Nocardia thailandica]|uniref:hypothetical protein n=1 Tax=Nocardia thailandica TaxID=257275 RepID=UPI0002DA5CD0|nr:hypothetical protein [Nocardia thailandica]